MDALSVFLRREARRAFDWHSANCMLLGADWAVDRGHPDPAQRWRARIKDEASAASVVGEYGGPAGLMRAALISLPEVANAVRGDLGLVTIRSFAGRSEACGIFTGMRWAVRGPRGLWIGRAEAAMVWRP